MAWNGLALAAVMAGPAGAAEPGPLRPTDVGGFALFTDMESLAWEGEVVRFRMLQVAESGFEVAGVVYIGGWRSMEVDCAARTIADIGFASLRADGVAGPLTPSKAEPRPIAAGGADEAVARTVCDGQRTMAADDMLLEDAVEAGQKWIPTGGP